MNHWIIRIGDGENFKKSKKLIWGMKKNNKGYISKNFKQGDILWFLKNKDYGGEILGMAEYNFFKERSSETLVQIETHTNFQLGWEENTNWDLEIHYKNLYDTSKSNIKMIIQCASTILNYKTFKDRINENLEIHYSGFKKYGSVKFI